MSSPSSETHRSPPGVVRIKDRFNDRTVPLWAIIKIELDPRTLNSGLVLVTVTHAMHGYVERTTRLFDQPPQTITQQPGESADDARKRVIGELAEAWVAELNNRLNGGDIPDTVIKLDEDDAVDVFSIDGVEVREEAEAVFMRVRHRGGEKRLYFPYTHFTVPNTPKPTTVLDEAKYRIEQRALAVVEAKLAADQLRQRINNIRRAWLFAAQSVGGLPLSIGAST